MYCYLINLKWEFAAEMVKMINELIRGSLKIGLRIYTLKLNIMFNMVALANNVKTVGKGMRSITNTLVK